MWSKHWKQIIYVTVVYVLGNKYQNWKSREACKASTLRHSILYKMLKYFNTGWNDQSRQKMAILTAQFWLVNAQTAFSVYYSLFLVREATIRKDETDDGRKKFCGSAANGDLHRFLQICILI